ncbi:nuclear transport factor 2 family protein [Flavitalea flava]
MIHSSKPIKALYFVLLSSFSLSLIAQAPDELAGSGPVARHLMLKDSLLFNAIFNTHRLQEVESVYAPDFAFYQIKRDQEPASVTLQEEFMGNIKRRWANGKEGPGIKREASFVQTFPQKDSSVMQTGVQRFFLVIPGGTGQLVETSRFSRIWKWKDGSWKIAVEIDNVEDNQAAQDAAMKARPIYMEIAHMDSVAFNAFNARDFNTFKSVFSEDLEFYQDKTGFSTYSWNMENFRKHLEDLSKHVRRVLVEGTLQVYPISNYGAVEIGVHQFYGIENGQEKLEATAKFITLWHRIDGQWKITREISYDHQ